MRRSKLDLKCDKCLDPLDRTPSGYWVCVRCGGRLMSDLVAINKFRAAIAPELEALRKAAASKRESNRKRVASLPLATQVSGTTVFTLDDREGMWRRCGPSHEEAVEVLLIHEIVAETPFGDGKRYRQVVGWVKRAKRISLK